MYHDKNYIETQCTIILYSKIIHLCYDPHTHWNLRVITKLETAGLCITEASTEPSCWCSLNGLLFYVWCVRNLWVIIWFSQENRCTSWTAAILGFIMEVWSYPEEKLLYQPCACFFWLSRHGCQVTYRTNSRTKLSLLTVSEDLSPPWWGRSARDQGSGTVADVFTSGQIQKQRTRAKWNP